LKALLQETGTSLRNSETHAVRILVDEVQVGEVSISPEDSDVMQQVDLSKFLSAGTHSIQLIPSGNQTLGFQMTSRYHLPESPTAQKPEPFSIAVEYDRTQMSVNDTVTATATLTNSMLTVAAMVVVDLPIPAGFAIQTEDLRALQQQGKIAKFQQNARSAVVYLHSLDVGPPLQLTYRLKATLPVKLTAPPATVYEYYNEDNHASSDTTVLTVVE
jgi:alpha-2-macroglobulin-like protein